MRSVALRSVAVLVMAVVSLSGCSRLQSGPDDPLQSELNRQRRVWRTQGIDSYTYTVRRLCFCAPPFTTPVEVRVRGGRAESRTFTETGTPVDAEHARLWPTVEGLFDVVQDAIDRRAASISVEYHAQLGYPTSISIDYDQRMADEELTLTAADLLPQR